MGVTRCDREGCTEILCHILVGGSHYVCVDCYAELEWVSRGWPRCTRRDELLALVAGFLDTPRTVRDERDADPDDPWVTLEDLVRRT